MPLAYSLPKKTKSFVRKKVFLENTCLTMAQKQAGDSMNMG